MTGDLSPARVHRRLVDALYTEAMVLADEARAYFDEGGRADREALGSMARVAFSCESLKITTRLMHVIAWLLTERAIEAGELQPADRRDPNRRLGDAPPSDPTALAALPVTAQTLVHASIDLHRRAARIDEALDGVAICEGPARSMLQRLAGSF